MIRLEIHELNLFGLGTTYLEKEDRGERIQKEKLNQHIKSIKT